MACKACQQSRQRQYQAYKNGSFREGLTETVKGVGMMTGILPKNSTPDSKSRR